MKHDAFLIILRAPGRARRLTAAAEREAAPAAVSVVRLHRDRPGGIGFVVDAADMRASRRIAACPPAPMAEMPLSASFAKA